MSSPSAPRLISRDVSSSFMALRSLRSDLESAPDSADLDTVQSLGAALQDRSLASQTCAPFVYQETAKVLSSIMISSDRPEVSQAAFRALESCALETLGNPCMAAAHALGTLPLTLPAFAPPEQLSSRAAPAQIDLEQVLKKANFRGDRLFWAGRNLIASDSDREELLVLKCARNPEKPEGLVREAGWVSRLAQDFHFPASCELPRLLGLSSHPLVRLSFPSRIADTSSCFAIPGDQQPEPLPGLTALPYVVSRDYFAYPNEPGQLPDPEQLLQTMARASENLGRLSSNSVLHTAAIPLFHNRTQQTRRDDAGRYIWTRKGRLDRWLDSCRYPNFSLSGLRDFEHLSFWNGQGRELFLEMGAQILSLLLVAGSTFRSKAPGRVGLDQNGTPCDCRDLFDPDLLSELVSLIVTSYHRGFTGRSMQTMPASQQHLIERMIEELGVDNHMTETLRVRDQETMSEAEFKAFLTQRGLKLKTVSKGAEDVSLITGPHLGEFNSVISLPELIDFTAAAAAVCISTRYLDEHCPDQRAKQPARPAAAPVML